MNTVTKNGVSTHSLDDTNDRWVEYAGALESMGLGTYPELLKLNIWSYPERRIVRDPHDRAIICTNGWQEHIATVMTGMLGRKIERMDVTIGDRKASIFNSDASVSVPERHSLVTMNRYFDEYRPGLHAKDCDINLPYALHAIAAPVNFLNEADAYELAAAIEEAFNADSVDVARTDEGYTVVVRDDGGDLNGWASERIAGITGVVEAFSLTPKRKVSFEISGGEEARYGSSLWQLRVTERHTQQQRIEDGINAILASLGDVGSAGKGKAPAPAKTPAKAVDASAEGDKHTIAKSAKKTRIGK